MSVVERAGMTIDIPYAEMLVSYACNLHCDGCQNYSNYALKGSVETAVSIADMRAWSRRISPRVFRILGGEPLLHPDLAQLIRVAAECWPNAQRTLVTNGLLINRRDDILEALLETGTIIEVSIHSNDPKYLERMKPGMAALKSWIAQGVRWNFGDSRGFIRTYRGIGKHMRPYNHDPVKAWIICSARECVNIYDSRLWKCPTISMLAKPLEKFGLTEHSDWKPFLEYKGLGLDASDEELGEFLRRGPEDICSICPDSRDHYQKDVFNMDFDKRGDRAEVHFPQVDFNKFLEDC
jgi:hypothetical protein